MPETNRYRGKPLLLVVERYALAVIGELPADREEAMRALVQRAFGGGGDWKQTVRARLRWAETIDDEIRANWKRFQDAANKQGIPVAPVAFARVFADEYGQTGVPA